MDSVPAFMLFLLQYFKSKILFYTLLIRWPDPSLSQNSRFQAHPTPKQNWTPPYKKTKKQTKTNKNRSSAPNQRHLLRFRGPFRTYPERSVSELCELPVDWRRLVEKVHRWSLWVWVFCGLESKEGGLQKEDIKRKKMIWSIVYNHLLGLNDCSV